MNLVEGFARLFTVLHYVLLPLFLFAYGLLIFDMGTREHQLQAYVACVVIIAYYITLAFDKSTQSFIGPIFQRYPILTGIALLWTDFCAGAALFYFALLPHISDKLEPYQRLTFWQMVMIWVVPLAIAYITRYAIGWVSQGFRQAP